jgi:hypothetical protein
MPELKKRIVIASVLKPLNDTRMTEKIATSLAEDSMNEVHVIGFPSAVPADARITFHTFPAFNRLSVARWFAPARILRMILRIKPALIIVATHELLLAGVVAKTLLRAKLIYDVQENYYLNIRHTVAFPALLRLPVAACVRLKERLASHSIDHFFLAEQVYAQQLTFLETQCLTVIENKVRKPEFFERHPRPMQLVFTGTLARSTGIFQAVALVKKLHQKDDTVTLAIIGFAALENEREELKREIAGLDFIQLTGGDTLVNHDHIVQAIRESHAGIIAYDLNPATKGRIPTKLYEYIGYGLPLIFLKNEPEWCSLATESGAQFIQVNDQKDDISNVLSWLENQQARGTFNDQVSWENEGIKLQTAISAL